MCNLSANVKCAPNILILVKDKRFFLPKMTTTATTTAKTTTKTMTTTMTTTNTMPSDASTTAKQRPPT
jgi:hypothetical protein